MRIVLVRGESPSIYLSLGSASILSMEERHWPTHIPEKTQSNGHSPIREKIRRFPLPGSRLAQHLCSELLHILKQPGPPHTFYTVLGQNAFGNFACELVKFVHWVPP